MPDHNRTSLPMFERDPDQSKVSKNCTAYIVRSWGVIQEGVVSEVRVTQGLPHLRFVQGGSTCLARYPDEVSRVFVRNDALVDPEVFKIKAPSIPNSVPESVNDNRWEWDP